jgi:uncharacterized protein (TIGR03083 family)
MTDVEMERTTLQELRFALAEGDAQAPPAGLADAMLARALETRPPGIPAGAPVPIEPLEGFRRAVTSLDELLGSLADDEWRRPALRGLDVQGLVGHLIGVERGFLRALDASDDTHADDDHVATTQPFASRQHGRDPSATRGDWRAAVDDTLSRMDELVREPAGLDKAVALYGIRMPVGTLVVVRTFELWTHEEDVRRATARPLPGPDTASLRLMTCLAVQLIPAGMARAGRSADGRSARVVLTGPGGGTWQTGLGLSDFGRVVEGPADVKVVADAVEFCRLVANRIDPGAFDAVVTGDGALARDLFAAATTLALD